MNASLTAACAAFTVWTFGGFIGCVIDWKEQYPDRRLTLLSELGLVLLAAACFAAATVMFASGEWR